MSIGISISYSQGGIGTSKTWINSDSFLKLFTRLLIIFRAYTFYETGLSPQERIIGVEIICITLLLPIAFRFDQFY